MATPTHPGTGSLALLALALTCAATAHRAAAQTHKVEAPDKVTRAIGVYEWTGDLTKPTAARLIPVTLFINGHTEDAGVFLARPVPFALQTGDVYSIERAGEALGTLDLDFARSIVTRHSGSDDDLAGAWYGYGHFITAQEEAKLARLKPSAKPSVIIGSLDDPDSEDTPPHFIYRQPSTTDPKPSGDTKTSGDTRTSSSPAPPADPDRPVLQRRDSGTTTASTTPNPAPDDDPERPTLRHRDAAPPGDSKNDKQKKEKPGGYVTGPSDSLNNDPDRPTLRRGLPSGLITTAQLSGLPPDLHQAVAVSDPANHDPHPFAREWESAREHRETLAAIQQLAQPRVANYLLTNKLTLATTALADPSSTPTPSSRPQADAPPATAERPAAPVLKSTRTTPAKKPAKTTAPPAPAPVPLTDEQLSAYTLSYGGLPTFVYTAEVAIATGGPVYVTLVVQRLPAGEFQVALSSVTDAAHLNRTPWLRPVDVVDPDWSHRASILFELRAQTSRQFALYRLTSAKAEQTFLTGIIE